MDRTWFRGLCDYRLHGDFVAGHGDVFDHDCVDVFDHWFDEWHELHVLGDGDECQWHFGGGFGCGGSVHGSGCSDCCVGLVESEHWFVGFLDCTGFEWWGCDHGLHGDFVAGCEDVYDHGCDELHGSWSDESHELHVHCDGHEPEWYFGGVCGFSCCDPDDCSGSADSRERDVE